MIPRPLTAASYRFAAAAHRREAAIRRESPLIFQRDFAEVLEGWADNADARADELEAAAQPDLFRGAA
ncbi:MAG: hypothetical protein Q7J28_02680 [Caulobacter sp.]|nr:hypothetical protein [Caulobacter sp.]